MNLNEYLVKNGCEFVNEGFICPEQRIVIDKHVDWSKVKTVLEIGFNAGHSSEFFLSHDSVTVTSFELSMEKSILIGKQYIDEKYPERHELIYGDSTVTIPKFEMRKFDLIFIDGGHEVEVARADIANCMRFARPDTILIIDGVVYEHAWAAKYTVGPTRAWREFIQISVLEETFHCDFSDGRGMSIGRYKVFHDYSVQKPKVVDAFMMYNELDMLKYRLTVMDPYVDQFVICECPFSHAGIPKPLFFEKNKHLFEPWLHKITHLVWSGHRSNVEDLDDSWFNENNQRNHLLHGLKDLSPNDIVIISDLDEIISPKILERLDDILGTRPIVALSMDLYYYDIEHFLPDPWKFARIARYSFVRDVTPHKCRNTPRKDPVVKDAGWHMAFFGNDAFIVNKTKNYAHIEAAEFFSHVNVRDVKKLRVAVSASSDRQLTFIPKETNPRLPPHLDILPYQVI